MYRPYTPPRQKNPTGRPFGGGCLQLFLGFIAFFISTYFFAMLIVIAGSTGSLAAGIAASVIVLGLLVAGHIAAWKYMHWRLFIVGYLIGLGLVLLALGLCFSIMGNRKF
jgi:hypothetical protein